MRILKNYSVLVTLLLFILTANFSKGQNIYTVAGSNVAGYSGDGGIATAAKLYQPEGVAMDASGNLYIADTFNQCIRKVDTHDSITTVAGNGTPGYSGDGGQATAAELNYPTGVAVDASGNIYIGDYDNSRIRKVNTSGVISTFAGNGAGGYSGDGGQATAAGISLPQGVFADNSGNVYIAQYFNNVIRKVNKSGIISTVAGTGSAGFSGDGGQATAANLNGCSAVWVDASGNLYIADTYNNRARMVNTSGIITTIAGNGTGGFSGDGGAATAAGIYYPNKVEMDGSGNVFITDQNNHIRKVNTSGIISTIAGNGTAGFSGDGGASTAAELDFPRDLVIDASDNIFVADFKNNCIREITTGSALAVNEISSTVSYSTDVYPNPSSGVFYLQLSGFRGKSLVEVYNILGEKVYTASIQGALNKINMSNNAAGIYLYKITTETGELASEGKFIIQNNKR